MAKKYAEVQKELHDFQVRSLVSQIVEFAHLADPASHRLKSAISSLGS